VYRSWKSKTSAVAVKSLPNMSTEKSSTGQNIESLRAALAAAKVAVESLENALRAAEQAAATVAVLAMVETVEEAIPEEPVAFWSREWLIGPATSSQAVPVFVHGRPVGYLRKFFWSSSEISWGAFFGISCSELGIPDIISVSDSDQASGSVDWADGVRWVRRMHAKYFAPAVAIAA
jgi:hypothetical protein